MNPLRSDIKNAAPLAGQRIIDLTQNVAGPYCSQILADLGAEIIKIERPGAGDDTRHWEPQTKIGISATYATLNRGKCSVAIDLNHASGQTLLRRLLKPDDILIHSMKPGSAEKRGLSYEDLRIRSPGLIYCALSAFGNVGPFAERPGYDPLIQAYSGIMSVNGHDEQPPARVGVSMVDMGAGLWSAIGILTAIIRRKENGLGSRVDTSLLETGIAWMTNPIANYSASGKLPHRMGSAAAMLAPYEVFETADGYIFIGCGSDRMFQKLAAAIDRVDLTRDPRFIHMSDRVAHRQVLHNELATLTRNRTTRAILDKLEPAGVPVSPVNNLSEALNDAQVQALALHHSLNIAGTELIAIGTPIRFDGSRLFDSHLSVRVGQNTDEILREAGFSGEEIGALVASGTIEV